MVLQTTLDGCIDGTLFDFSQKLIAHMDTTATISRADGKQAKVQIVVRLEGQESYREAAKK